MGRALWLLTLGGLAARSEDARRVVAAAAQSDVDTAHAMPDDTDSRPGGGGWRNGLHGGAGFGWGFASGAPMGACL